MNIKEAKLQIKNTITAYLSKNSFGEYEIPLERQRPVFLMGPPGIGKTAIMEQIAQELGIGIVSYSMTHHTRQSALGLPFIVRKSYGGREYDVSEYTMSEIIASVYDSMEATGITEGILFLDEINCVSETLTPAMLQFLQYKIFGRHRVPEGWIVVTAGNPTEYNNSVREFDIVTWDRLKRIDVDPDFEAWKEYAYHSGVHAAVMTYLEIRKADFYTIETTVDGKRFATARGWSDLSEMLRLYEKLGISVDEKLTGQYLQNTRIARDFAVYYDLFNKYRADYQVDHILAGKAGTDVTEKAKNARFDERLSLIGLMLSAVTAEAKRVCTDEQVLSELAAVFKALRMEMMRPGAVAAAALENQLRSRRAAIDNGIRAGNLSADARHVAKDTIALLEPLMAMEDALLKGLQQIISDRRSRLKADAGAVGEKMSNMFRFCEDFFGAGQEIQILVTELTVSHYGAKFISRYGCAEYYAHNSGLLLSDRRKELLAEIDELTMPLDNIL
ncbi:MAG: AAA family ATPase [Oscillospiraceae bacterium]|nr:AAA family ATPase [Oscillospiraceae bacterium]